MKVVIANGNQEADYIIKTFNTGNNQIKVINKDKAMCEYLSFENKIECICGDSTQKYILDLCGIDNYDIFVSLSTDDVENYMACIMAKKLFHVKKCIARVINPKNVELFKFLGVDSVISSSYLLGETIKAESMVDNFIKSLSILDQKIEMTEIRIEENAFVAGKLIRDLKLPSTSQICCIYREPAVIIPNGNTKISAGDRLITIYSPEVKDKLLGILQRKN